MTDSASREKRPQRWGRRLGNALAFALFAVIMTEALLRLYGLASPVLYEHDPAAGYRLRPGQRVRYLGNRITINNWGVRDPRNLDTKPEGATRVLLLGDSVTWGGVKKERRILFPTLLESMLPRTQVINAGVNGYSVTQMAALYDAHLRGLAPDVILVQVIPEDFTREPVSELNGPSSTFPFAKPRLALVAGYDIARTVFLPRLPGASFDAEPFTVPRAPSLSDAEKLERNLGALIALRKELPNPVKLCVVVTPRKGGAGALAEDIGGRLKAAGIPVIELGKRLAATPEMFADPVHFTALGHAKAAEALAQALLKLKVVELLGGEDAEKQE